MSVRRKVHKNIGPPQHEVDIVMPVYGQTEITRKALGALLTMSLNKSFNVIVVDDCSPMTLEHDQMLRDYDAMPNIRVYRKKKNEGFIAATNFGVRQGRAPLIVLVNSDVVVSRDCIQNMLIPFQEEMVGVTGAKLLFPPKSSDERRPAGKVQHAGIVFDSDLMPQHVHMGWDPRHPKTCLTREMQAVTGALLATRRFLWKEIGGFDSIYGRGTFEDMDYCIRSRLLNYGVIYCAEALAVHVANASVASLPIEQQFPLSRNRNIFMMRMQGAVVWDEWRYW